jgi:hypothetical protein
MATPSQRPAENASGADKERELIARLGEIEAQRRVIEDQLVELQVQGKLFVVKPNGAAVATMVAAGFGAAMVGFFTTLAEASAGIKDWLNFYDPTGPLSGKTTMAGILWLGVWVPAVLMFRKRELDMSKAIWVTLILVAVGVLLTFPPVFEVFAAD